MRLTERCMDLLKLLDTARWLTTNQIHTRFFAHATYDATRKRLRKLTGAKYLVTVRQRRMELALFTLGPEGKRQLERIGSEPVNLERRPPLQKEHFLGVNDLRIAAELAGDLAYFFAYWELPSLGWINPIIPDAVLTLNGRGFAIEYDRGGEGLQFFVRTKISRYQQLLGGTPFSALLIVTDTAPRMAALAQAIGQVRIQVFFTTLDLIRAHGFLKPVFYRTPGGEGVSLV